MKVIDKFKSPNGKPVTIVASNVFAVLQLDALENGDQVYQVISTGGFGVEIVVPKGQELGAWLVGE